MNKKKDIQPKVFKWTLGVIVAFLATVFVLPNIYLMSSYFSIPNNIPLNLSNRIVVINDRQQDLCVQTQLPSNTIQSLRIKLVIDETVVPYWQLNLQHTLLPNMMSGGTSTIVCTTPVLQPGIYQLLIITQPSIFNVYGTRLEFEITQDGFVRIVLDT